MFYLENSIKDYHWGIIKGITKYFGIKNNYKRQAEMWMGAHPSSSSFILDSDQKTSLKDYLKKNSQDFFQEQIKKKFQGQLPFLFKILCIAEPLSIQCHPNQKQAELAFQAKNRIYKDNFPKEELLYAYTEVELLCGFRKNSEIYHYFSQTKVFDDLSLLKSAIKISNFRLFYRILSTMTLSKKKQFIKKMVSFAKGKSDQACKTLLYLYQFYPDDVYISAAFFMNIITLKPGEAIFLEPQIIHSYIKGVGFEIMSNSDNVLRVGLTSKETHLQELLKIAKFQPYNAQKVYSVTKNNFDTYSTKSTFFQLKTKKINKKNQWQVENVTILFCSDGNLEIEQEDKLLTLTKGQSILLKTGSVNVSGNGFLFVATV